VKNFWVIILLGILTVSLFIGGCSATTDTPEPQKEGENEAVTEEKFETIELKFVYFGPETGSPGQAMKRAAQAVEERTNGRVKITNYFSQSLLQMNDTYVGLVNGVADIAYLPVVHTADIHPFLQIFNMLFETEPPSRPGIQRAYEDILQSYPVIQEELEATGLRMLAVLSLPVYNIHTVNKEVRVPADLKGMRICIASGAPTEWLNSMPGVAAVNLPSGDYYMNLERNLVGGISSSWEAVKDYMLFEVVKKHTVLGENQGGAYSAGVGIQMSLNSWNSLPPDIQEILTDAYQNMCREMVEIQEQDRLLAIEEASSQGNTIINITSDERQLWADYMKPINEKWIEETEALGKPAREAYEALLEAFKKYK
jgi:TRAP-type C4-dicarboxylate transport system substrate-binding protein